MDPTFLAGKRLQLDDAPTIVTEWAARIVGEPISRVTDCTGGMSQGVAALVTGSQRSIFVKAISPKVNPYAAQALQHEAQALARLPLHRSIPGLVAHDTVDSEHEQWVVLAQTAAAGATPHPWTRTTAQQTLTAWGDVSTALADMDLEGWELTDSGDFLSRWNTIAARPDDPWHAKADRWQDRCSSLASDILAGDLVVSHVDLRADNILVSSDTVSFVDWAHTSLAASWLDPLLLVLDMVGAGADLRTGGSIDLTNLWASHPVTRSLPAELLITGAAALAGALHVTGAHPLPELPHRATWANAMASHLLKFAES